MTDRNLLLERALSLNSDPDAIREFYAEWAKTYDMDLLLAIGYVAPKAAANALVKHIRKNALVLDAGCGTGLVGLELIKHDASLTIDGIDLTPEMLEMSRKSGAYRKLNEADMSGPLFDIGDNEYDAVISAGVFTDGHVGPGGIDELVRITKPGGTIVITVRDTTWKTSGFKDKTDALSADGRAKMLELTLSPYHTKEDIFCQVCVLEVL